MLALMLALLAASGAPPKASEGLPGEVGESVQRALALPSARILPLHFTGVKGCPAGRASVARPIDGSGRYPVRMTGHGCTGWGWVDVQVWAETSVTTRVVRAGEPLAPACTVAEREVRPGRPPFVVPADAVASRTLPVGAAVGEADIRRGSVSVGDPIKVVFLSGTVAIEAQGRRTQCLRMRDCAVLASGKHVEGQIDESGRLLVEVPR